MSEIDYLPYKSINVLIEREPLEDILKRILQEINTLPKPDQINFVKEFKKYVKINGFRNPTMAPLAIRVMNYADAFEEKNEVIPFTFSTWTKTHPAFSEAVQKQLESLGFDNLLLQRKYEENKGFLPNWPQDLSTEAFLEKFHSANPKIDFDENAIIAMAAWISGKLPEE